MSEAWLNFAIVVFVQLLLFVICAYYEKRLSDVARILGWGVLTGIVFGTLLDHVVGEFFALSSYALGFGSFFLIINAALSYGLFAGTILLLQQVRLLQFYIWTFVVVAVYEITNYFFPVWTWKFASTPVEFLVGLSVGYFGGAVLIAIIWHVFFGYRFRFISDLQ